MAYPPQALSQKVSKDTIADYTKRLRTGLNISMMNIQFVIKDEQVYVIEVSPRTGLFLSCQVTDIPMAQVATRSILGGKLGRAGL